MNEKNVRLGIVLVVVGIAIYYLSGAIKIFFESLGLSKTGADKATEKAPVEALEQAKKDIADALKKQKASNKLSGKQKQLIAPTLSPAKYKQLSETLFTAMDGIGTDTTAVENVFSQLKNVADVNSLIVAYDIKRLSRLGVPESIGLGLVGHLTNEGAIEAANKGLNKNKVYYKF